MLDNVLDYRLCVSRETAGESGDFERAWDVDGGLPDFEIYGRRWEQSQSRQEIPANLLPRHLRWDASSSLCPSGILRIGNPDIRGNKATVYVENPSGVHGWAGDVTLVKVNGKWVVLEQRNWWQA